MRKKIKKIMVAPSILSADFSRLAEEIRDVEKAGADVIHVDVMDGHFVPNLTIGPAVIRCLRKTTRLPLDVHLMIDNPARSLAGYIAAGSDWITIHIEAEKKVRQTLALIRKAGLKAGLSVKPKTPVSAVVPYLKELDLVLVMTVEPGFGGQAFMPCMVEKIKWLRPRYSGLISVDGGITAEHAPCVSGAGADVLVAGTAVFGQKDRGLAVRGIRNAGCSS